MNARQIAQEEGELLLEGGEDANTSSSVNGNQLSLI